MLVSLENFTDYREKIPFMSSTCSVDEALSYMSSNAIEYLPIVENNVLEGIVTYKSVVIAVNSFNMRIEELSLSHIQFETRNFGLNENINYVLSALDEYGVVGLVDYNKCEHKQIFVDLLTNRDIAMFLYSNHKDLMTVKKIELMIRGLIEYSCSDISGKLDSSRLDEVVRKVESRKSKGFETLTLFQYNIILLDASRWEFFAPHFKLKPEQLEVLLDDVRDARNQIMHFRGELSAQQREKLSLCLNLFTPIHTKLGKQISE